MLKKSLNVGKNVWMLERNVRKIIEFGKKCLNVGKNVWMLQTFEMFENA